MITIEQVNKAKTEYAEISEWISEHQWDEVRHPEMDAKCARGAELYNLMQDYWVEGKGDGATLLGGVSAALLQLPGAD